MREWGDVPPAPDGAAPSPRGDPLFHSPTTSGPAAAGRSDRRRGEWWLSPSGRTAVRTAPAHQAAEGVTVARVEARELLGTREILDAANLALARTGARIGFEVGPSDGIPAELLDKGLLRLVPVFREVGGRERRGNDLLGQTECTNVAAEILATTRWRAVFRSPTGAEASTDFKVDTSPAARAESLGVLSRLFTRLGQAAGPADLVARIGGDEARYLFTWDLDGVRVDVDAAEAPGATEEGTDAGADDGTSGADPSTASDGGDGGDGGDGDGEDSGDLLSDAARAALLQLVSGGVPQPVASGLIDFIDTNIDSRPAVQQEVVRELPKGFGALTDADEIERVLDGLLEKARDRLKRPHPDYDEAGVPQLATIAARFGVNEAAAPGIGEVFVTAATRPATPAESKERGSKWDHHLATVVALDGDTRITLENYNRSGVPGAPKLWFVAMYGPERNSLFHSQWGPESTAPVTFVLRKAD